MNCARKPPGSTAISMGLSDPNAMSAPGPKAVGLLERYRALHYKAGLLLNRHRRLLKVDRAMTRKGVGARFPWDFQSQGRLSPVVLGEGH